jgi:hypothetical protein
VRDAILRPVITGGYARAFVPAVNQIRARAALSPLSGPMDLYQGAPLVLYMTAQPFEYPRVHWPENILMVGPCAWEPPATPPDWLRDSGAILAPRRW